MAHIKFTTSYLQHKYQMEDKAQSALFANGATSTNFWSAPSGKGTSDGNSRAKWLGEGTCRESHIPCFYRGQETEPTIHMDHYSLDNIERIVSIILSMLR